MAGQESQKVNTMTLENGIKTFSQKVKMGVLKARHTHIFWYSGCFFISSLVLYLTCIIFHNDKGS